MAYKTVIGLDIGQYAVKAVRAVRRGGAFRVTHQEQLRLPQGMAAAESAAMLQRWMAQQGFKDEPCVIGMRGLQVLFQTLTLPPQDPRPSEQAVAMEIARLSEISNETMMHGFSPIPAENGVRRFLIALVRTEKADDTLAAARAAGVNVVDIVPTPIAAGLLPPSAADGTGPVTVRADIGQGGTDVAIGIGSTIRFARSFGIGGQFFTESMTKGRRMTASQAEPNKIAGGLEGADALQKETLTSAAESWTSELKSCLAIYKSFFPGDADQPAQVVLSGGGAHLKGLDRFLAYKLGMEVHLLPALPGAESAPDPATYAVACGLALAGAGEAPGHISLLPGDLREAILLRRQKGYWVGAAAVAGLVLGVSLLGGYRDYQRVMRHQKEQAAMLQRCRDLDRETKSILARNEVAARRLSAVRVLLENGPVFRDAVNAVGACKPDNCWVTLIADTNSYYAVEAPPKTETRRPPGDPRARRTEAPGAFAGDPAFRQVIVEGYTSDPSLGSVRRMIEALRERGYGADLLGDDKLASTNDTRWAAAGGKRFAFNLTAGGTTP